jgi:hypothetical protein
MNSFALTQFETFAKASNEKQALEFLFKNPVLFLTPYWPKFNEWGQKLPTTKSAQALHSFNRLVEYANMLASHNYPLGTGPLEQIIRRLNQSEISQSSAHQLASTQQVYQNLSPLYINALSMSYKQLATQDSWQDALQAQKVLLAALDARRAANLPSQDEMEMIVSIDYAAIVAHSVRESADGRLFRDAVQRATAVSKVDTRPWFEPGAVEFSLAVLHLDPYTLNRTSSNFEMEISAWRQRTFDYIGVRREEKNEVLVPKPLEAFEIASKFFLASADKRTGVHRGLSLNGYISAELWKQVLGVQAADNIPAIADEAMELLSDDRYTNVRAEINVMLRFYMQSESGKTDTLPVNPNDTDWTMVSQMMLEQDASQMVQQEGLYKTTEQLHSVAQAVAGSSPEVALDLWLKALPLMLLRDESTRKLFFEHGLGYLLRTLADPNKELFTQQSPLADAEKCIQMAVAENWPSLQMAATLLSIVINSQIGDRETEGVEVLEMATNADDTFAEVFDPLLCWLRGILHRGIASNMFFAGDYHASMLNYAKAANEFLKVNMLDEAIKRMSLGVDIVGRSEESLLYFIILTPELERQGGLQVVDRLQLLARDWIQLLVRSEGVNLNALMMLLNMVKGSMFASELQAGGSFPWIDSSESRVLLNRIEELRKILDVMPQQTAKTGILSDEDLLTMYADEKEIQEGETPAVMLHNLEIRYDAELHRELYGRSTSQREWLPLPDTIQSLLGPETVLITYYSGIIPNGNTGLYATIITKEEITCTIADFGTQMAGISFGGLLCDILAMSVSRLRKHLNEEPDNGVMSNAASDALKSFVFLRGSTEQILIKLRKQGKWHLCIHPHGPLHFFPFYLLPFGDGLVADQFAVTYFPHLELLNPAYASAPVRDQPIASFGIEFKNGIPHRLPELPGAEGEAQMVAATYGETPMIGAAATKTELVAALTHASRIHIATHGLHRVSAPSFQRIYLSPDANSNGILYAYDLLRYDLRGLDLLTFSACETSLGRVDIGDNLRGLPANALIAGAATVIGTLWPVENETAKTFFGLLHQKLAAGSGKREAFHFAQRDTRAKHPEFRDWGAFCYTGRW